MYVQQVSPVGGSLAFSGLVAALPLVVLFVLLGGFRVRAWLASLVSLVIALVIAVAVYAMPVGQALLAGSEGAVFGFYPILWIVINALWIYQMTVRTGHFEVLRRSFGSVSDDQRVQAVIIAFAFGALLEALAGFGTPVAICTIMLIALRFAPIKAAVVALVANTAPVAFGAIAVPITTLAKVTSLPEPVLGAMVGRQTPILAVFVPFVLVALVDGWRGVRETWAVALAGGLVFAVAQFVTSNYVSLALTDIVASLLSAGAVVLLVRIRPPRHSVVEEPTPASPVRETVSVGGGTGPDAGGTDTAPPPSAGGPDDADRVPDNRRDTVLAYMPYLIIIALFSLQQVPPVKALLDAPTTKPNWPGLNIMKAPELRSSSPKVDVTFKLDFFMAAGTILLVAGLLTMLVLRVSPRGGLAAYGQTLKLLATAIVTVMSVLALAYVMNFSGQTVTLGLVMAGAGGVFAVLSPILGWLGVAVTGSDTSSNSLFGALQVTAAKGAALNPLLLAAANSSGGVLGKMISPQNLAIAASAVGLSGREGEIFRKVLPWSLLFLAGMCVLVFLQSTPVLSWMVP